MKLLLDECIDRKLAREFVDYEVKTVPQMGWAGDDSERVKMRATIEPKPTKHESIDEFFCDRVP